MRYYTIPRAWWKQNIITINGNCDITQRTNVNLPAVLYACRFFLVHIEITRIFFYTCCPLSVTNMEGWVREGGDSIFNSAFITRTVVLIHTQFDANVSDYLHAFYFNNLINVNYLRLSFPTCSVFLISIWLVKLPRHCHQRSPK